MTIDVSRAALQMSLKQLADGTAANTPAHLSEKFSALMRKAPMAPMQAPRSAALDTVSKLAAAQDMELQHSVNDIADALRRAPALNVSELNIETIRLTYEIAGTQLDMEAKMSIVNASKSAIETLMKNQ
ncbi:type III secretion protein HrpB2 [Burkholderia oklahomensis]|uniref:Type III secretion protein HrpB2 n=1 Tax=Burkholderia oklahomensis TaxID=342113 RepID=A0AAI8FRZ2_9BURK|nr:type III secretion protein HrpB2 [Burkholderia oklahomensis]AIO70452.1 type III secretion protein HrpB2 [Burkholderia oklahomensis]AJX34525.1 type III secretion protein HrpB2 [Burkholderia oklahomensis C6786]AOI39597.1 type III secretion protein [Burkholderia oklahomensis EO147]AOI49278.1 type III secretion protein [Burkholderia oklahomensis C6786]KUY51528.1 type III secretion protein [Burkholderia oklahomensis EO147]